ncbi:hypothetical protein [Neorhodopirellula lusitana]|uniref:hypothetical protein n=1 Tax=Neorhodopirellula lusitana TaxID=445327 RepID=UPI00384BF167
MVAKTNDLPMRVLRIGFILFFLSFRIASITLSLDIDRLIGFNHYLAVRSAASGKACMRRGC